MRKPHEPPSSGLGKALQYLTNHQVALGRFLEYGYLPLDNGIVERLHVRCALTRKNYLFAGADTGGDRAAIAYSILGSCRLAGVDPLEYLGDVLPKLMGRIRIIDLRLVEPYVPLPPTPDEIEEIRRALLLGASRLDGTVASAHADRCAAALDDIGIYATSAGHR